MPKKGQKLDNRERKEILIDKLKRYSLPMDDEGHTIWIGPKNATGCCQIGFGRSSNTITAIQGVWEAAGKKKYKRLIHTCEKIDCVSINHIAPFKGQIPLSQGQSVNKKTKLTVDQVYEIRKELAAGISCPDLATKYNVSGDTINKIRRRITWKYI